MGQCAGLLKTGLELLTLLLCICKSGLCSMMNWACPARSTLAEFETPALASGRAGSTSAPVISAGRSAQPPSSPNPPAKPRGLLGRLLLRGVCAAGLPPAQAQVRPSSRWDEA